MTDTIVLLEERKEITTFLLDDGVKTLVDNVITTSGSSLGYEYSNKCVVDDILCISDKSAIGKESLRKYTGDATEVPVGVLVNEPIVMTNGERKGSVLLLGGLYRLKLASGQIVKAGDRIKLSANGAIVDNAGEFLAFHPVANGIKQTVAIVSMFNVNIVMFIFLKLKRITVFSQKLYTR